MTRNAAKNFLSTSMQNIENQITKKSVVRNLKDSCHFHTPNPIPKPLTPYISDEAKKIPAAFNAGIRHHEICAT